MKKFLLKLVAITLLAGFFHACNETLIEEPTTNDLELKSAQTGLQSYIVVLNDAELDAELSNLKGYEKRKDAAKKAASKVLKRASVDGKIGHAYGTAIKGFSVKIPPGQLKKLENDPSVKYAEEDKIIALIDPDVRIKKRPVPEPPEPPAESIPWGITRVNGGGANLPSGSPKAWIVDSGIDMDHPDLNVNTSLSKDFTGSGTPEDAHGHGTHVAGTVAAINNDIGVVGVAPNAEVISCRVLGSDGTGSFSWTIAALDYIAVEADTGDVINMSLGPQSRYTDQAVDDAVIGATGAGVKIAIAAGNENDDAIYYSPARTDAPNVYTISAMDSNDEFAYFSNYGSPVDYCDPGVNVYSTYKGASYATMSGTSMAAPHAAGLLLLGNTITDGYVIGDPDGNADPILVYDDGGTTPPVNQAPNADFSFTVSDLSVEFTNASSDSDGSIVSYAWDFGDGNSSTSANTSHTYTDYGTYSVTLIVTDDDDATDSYTSVVELTEAPPAGDITISAIGRKVRGIRYIDVTWSGATGTNVDIKLNGITQENTANDGSQTLNMGRTSGTFVVTVCETDGSACSNEVTVTI
jgi:subtilisin family serine protease